MARCEVDKCSRDAKTRGMCSAHYQRLYNRGTLDRMNHKMGDPCTTKGCNKKSIGRGLCPDHQPKRISRKEERALMAELLRVIPTSQRKLRKRLEAFPYKP